MPITPLSNVLPYRRPEREAMPEPVWVTLGEDAPAETRQDGALVTETGDGGVVVDLNPSTNKTKSDKHDANLAEELEQGELGRIANELLMGIQADDDSRQEWLNTHAEGIKLLGLVVEDNRSTAGDSAAPLEGMSTARHPLLLEACLMFQANARGEMLPAAGPVKVRDDRPNKPASAAPMMGHNGGPPLDGASPFAPPPVPQAAPGSPPAPVVGAPGAGLPQPPTAGAPPILPPQPPMPMPPAEQPRDELADALEKDFNHYLTTTAQEYYPDTDRMLFGVGFGGQGVKKVYNCPLRRRPVSESIAMEDFIVSNAMTDLGNAARITHKIKMRPSTLKRMQLLGVYCDIDLGQPTQSEQPNAVDQAKADIAGVQPTPTDPRDADYELFECYCELDLPDYAPKKFKGKGLALPYRVVIEKDSQRILEIRRNWREDDEQCMAKEFFVEFPYDKAFGFYGIGLLHILGNTTKTLTAAWRELIDSGMYANFPGFIYAKGAGRQLTNQFRVAPGSGVGLDIGLQRLQDAIMPLPYKDLGPAFTAFITHVEELGQRLGGTANISIGEGKQDAPVGTTLALIEQATKPIGAVLKRLHTAQSKEFQLLADRFRDDPEAFWRFNKRPTLPWQKEQFIKALTEYDLVPVSDPNNPTKLHRAAKSASLVQMATAAPGLLDPRKVFKRVANDLEIEDPDDLLAPPMPPQGPQVDPAKMASTQAKIQGDQTKAQTDVQLKQMEMADNQAERESRLRVAQVEQNTERLRLASTLAIHSDKIEQAERALTLKLGADTEGQLRDHIHGHAISAADRTHAKELQDAQLAQAAQQQAQEPAQ